MGVPLEDLNKGCDVNTRNRPQETAWSTLSFLWQEGKRCETFLPKDARSVTYAQFRRSPYMALFLSGGTIVLSCREIEDYNGFQPPLFFRPALASSHPA